MHAVDEIEHNPQDEGVRKEISVGQRDSDGKLKTRGEGLMGLLLEDLCCGACFR